MNDIMIVWALIALVMLWVANWIMMSIFLAAYWTIVDSLVKR
jgi:hypothetical protein